MTIAIRTATLADEETVLNLVEELFAPPGRRPEGYTRDVGRAGIQRAIGSEESEILLAVEDDVVIGMLALYVDFLMIRYGLRCWLEDFVVLPSQRSRGVGRMLLEAAAAWARARGCTHIQLNSFNGRNDAHRFYRANGMVQDSLSFNLPVGRG